jgi:hypothetical protein
MDAAADDETTVKPSSATTKMQQQATMASVYTSSQTQLMIQISHKYPLQSEML